MLNWFVRSSSNETPYHPHISCLTSPCHGFHHLNCFCSTHSSFNLQEPLPWWKMLFTPKKPGICAITIRLIFFLVNYLTLTVINIAHCCSKISQCFSSIFCQSSFFHFFQYVCLLPLLLVYLFPKDSETKTLLLFRWTITSRT